FYFFFFQAEDGIRDRNVTGVQTCALPICLATMCVGVGPRSAGEGSSSPVIIERHEDRMIIRLNRPEVRNAIDQSMVDALHSVCRSEERRVGKEWRWRRRERRSKENNW